MNTVGNAPSPHPDQTHSLPFSLGIDIGRPTSLVRFVHHWLLNAARQTQQVVLLDLGDAVGPAVADHFQPSPRDAAVEISRRRRVVSLNPFEARAGPAQRHRAVQLFLQVTQPLVHTPLTPSALDLVGLALAAAAELPAPTPLRAMDLLTDGELRRSAFSDARSPKPRQRWETLLHDVPVFAAACRWLEDCFEALAELGLAETMTTLPAQQALRSVVQRSRVTFVVAPDGHGVRPQRCAVLHLVMHQIESALSVQGAEDGAPPVLLVVGCSGAELNAICPALLRLVGHGCDVAVECSRVNICDGRALRLLATRGAAVADRACLPAAHPLVSAGLVPQKPRGRKAQQSEGSDRTVRLFRGRKRPPLELNAVPLPHSSLGYARLLAETERCAGAERGACAQALGAERERIQSRRRRRELAATLGDALTPDGLMQGFLRVRQSGGGPGSDGVTVAQFEEDLQRRLRRIASEIQQGRYRPRQLVRVRIPKRSGGYRQIQVAAVRDRVVQSALAIRFSAVVEPTLRPSVYGYRLGIGTHTAIAAVRQARQRGAQFAVGMDIESCFDTVDHERLWNRLGRLVPHEAALRLLRVLLAQWSERPGGRQARVGISQGSPLSPVLLNLYLTPLDRHMENTGVHYFRYADDILALGRRAEDAGRARRVAEQFLVSRLKMRLKSKKTRFVPPGKPLEYLGIVLHGELCRIPAARMEEFRRKAATVVEGDDAVEMRIEQLNQLVDGFSNYYQLIGRGTELDLAALDGWLETLHARFCAAEGIPRQAAAGLLRRLPRRAAASNLPVPSAVPYSQGSRGPPLARGPSPPPADAMDPLEVYEEPAASPPQARSEGRFFSRTDELRERRRKTEQGPVRLDGDWLRVTGHGLYLTRSGEALVVKRGGEVVFEAPLAGLGAVHVLTGAATLSTYLLDRLARDHVPVLLANPTGAAHGCVVPMPDGKGVRARRRQASLFGSAAGLEFCRRVVQAKLENQRRVLLYHAKYRRQVKPKLAQSLQTLAGQIQKFIGRLDNGQNDGTNPEGLMLEEARGARPYWEAVGLLLAGRTAFPGRKKRGARDLVNSLLNYGYAVLCGILWREVVATGLDPALGVLHSSRGDSLGLVYDLMEEHRQPVVDRAVLALLLRGNKLGINRRAELRMSSRNRLIAAIERQLDRQAHHQGESMPHRALVRHQVRVLRDALAENGPETYVPFRMRW